MSDPGFLVHAEQLRGHLIKSLVVFLLASVLFYPSAERALHFLVLPAGSVVFIAPAAAFTAVFSVTLWGGLVFSLPYILYHAWMFIGEGLTKKEKALLGLCVPASLVLFLTGVCFGFGVAVPAAMRFLLSYAAPWMTPMIAVDRYLDFVCPLLLGLGLVFQLPLVVFFLARAGVVRVKTFTDKRRHVMAGVLIVAAVLTPPDVLSQVFLAGPMLLLYEAGIVLAKIAGNKKPSR